MKYKKILKSSSF